ncbi:Leucine-rich repeat extensin-like protein 6 [Dendrobium catenatum]|uniref:Cell wall hydroxyproline-rich glycoprotein n=1 Tax=Dendrobium catenatum TaxID=906689 RepID=A0A2I0V6M4_9ASPA|nr:Leucine-rich repeat extensin-like protein 6 [Dendrobium catenatum]
MPMTKSFSSSVFFLLISSFPFHSLSQYPSPNPRLEKAYIALQAWKHAITSDPKNLTADWCGPHVCNYTGVFCAPAPDDPSLTTVAGIDLNHGRISGTLPNELSLLSDLALFHLNSNRFSGTLPSSLCDLRRLFELDVSNNRLSGSFPDFVLDLPELRFLDLRFNRFRGAVPAEAFNGGSAAKLDAFFVNDNQFNFSLPANFGNSTASVIVLANNRIGGCLPASIGGMGKTLNQLVILNTGLTGCIPPEIGNLKRLTVFDVSFNELVGPLPATMGEMKKLEQLDVAHNLLSGEIPEGICELPRLKNFTYSYNFFCDEPKICLKVRRQDDRRNCIPWRPEQRSPEECAAFLSTPVHCDAYGCSTRPPPSPPPPTPPPPPPPYHY